MSLYTVARKTRLMIKVSIVMLIMLMVGKVAWVFGYQLLGLFGPSVVETPTNEYGKLLSVDIPSLPMGDDSQPNFVLDTLDAKLPPTPDRMPVYKLTTDALDITREKNAVGFANKLGFKGQRREIGKTNWEWQKETLDQTLRLDIETKDFSIDTRVDRITSTVSIGNTPGLEESKNLALSFLSNYDLVNDELIKNATLESRYVRIRGNGLEKVERATDAHMVEVNFTVSLLRDNSDFPTQRIKMNDFQDKFKVVTDNAERGVIQMFISNSVTPDYKYPMISYSRQRIDTTQKSTYPIKTIEQAWTELKRGDGRLTQLRIINANPLGSHTAIPIGTIYIRDISLAYYDSGFSAKSYIMPVFVFRGEAVVIDRTGVEANPNIKETFKASYTALIPAIDNRCMTNSIDGVGSACEVIP